MEAYLTETRCVDAVRRVANCMQWKDMKESKRNSNEDFEEDEASSTPTPRPEQKKKIESKPQKSKQMKEEENEKKKDKRKRTRKNVLEKKKIKDAGERANIVIFFLKQNIQKHIVSLYTCSYFSIFLRFCTD